MSVVAMPLSRRHSFGWKADEMRRRMKRRHPWVLDANGYTAPGTTNAKTFRLVCKLTTEDFRYSIGVPSHCRALFPKHKQSIFFESNKARPRGRRRRRRHSHTNTHVPHRQWTNLSLYFNYILCPLFSRTRIN